MITTIFICIVVIAIILGFTRNILKFILKFFKVPTEILEFFELEYIFNNGIMNSIVGLLLSLEIFLIFQFGFIYSGMANYITSENGQILSLLIMLSVSFGFVFFTSFDTITAMNSYELLKNGAKTGIWLNAGPRLLFFKKLKFFGGYGFFDLFLSEKIHTGINDVDIPGKDENGKQKKCEAQDITGKWLNFEATIDWVVGATDEEKENYELTDATKIPENIALIYTKAIRNVIGKYDYFEEIKTMDINQEVLNQPILISKFKKYGIKTTPAIDIFTATFAEDNKIAQTERAVKRYRVLYPNLTDKEIANEVNKSNNNNTKEILVSNNPNVSTLLRVDE